MINLKEIDLKYNKRPQWVRIMNFQVRSKIEDWKEKDGLYYPINKEYFRELIFNAIDIAIESNVNLLVFPELTIVPEFITDIIKKTTNSPLIIVGGSHYNQDYANNISQCPIIYSGKAYYTHKIDPAPTELSGDLNNGSQICIFKNTLVGSFAVLICSDNLMDAAKDIVKHHELDFWVIPAFQGDSDWHYRRIQNDVEGARDSRYIIYSNNIVDGYADGKSAFFGQTDQLEIDRFIRKGYTDNAYKWRQVRLSTEDYFILDVDINHKRPNKPRLPKDEPNIKVVKLDVLNSVKERSNVSDKIGGVPVPNNGIQIQINNQEDNISVLHSFIVKNYLKDHIYISADIHECVELYSNVFKNVVSVKDYNGAYVNMFDQNIFEFLNDKIFDSSSTNPLIIQGASGGGKSTFLSILYIKLYDCYKHKKCSEIPVFINLHYYNRYVYPYGNKNIKDQAYDKLKEDLFSLLKNIAIENTGSKFVLIIDGIDEYISLKIVPDTVISDILQLFPISKIIFGIRKHSTPNNHAGNKIYNISSINDPDIFINIDSLNCSEEKYISFVSEMSIIESKITSRLHTEIYKSLTELVKKYKLEQVDFLLLTILVEACKSKFKYESTKNLSDFLYIYFNDLKVNLYSAPLLAYDVFNKPMSISGKQKNCYEWWIIQKYDLFRDYLVAYYISKKLLISGKKSHAIFDYVYPFSLNAFCKDILNSNLENQEKALDTIKNIMHNSTVTAKTHLCYLLGRIDDYKIKSKAIDLLFKTKDQLLNANLQKLNFNLQNKLPNFLRMDLLLLRTIYISLSYLGEDNASDEYISMMLKNKYFEIINRGFHLEYYGDITFDPSSPDNLQNEDNLCDYDKTFEKLYNKLNNSIKDRKKYNLFEIELYTLTSLAQHRQVNKINLNYDESLKRGMISNLIKQIFNSGVVISDTLLRYLRFILPILDSRENVKVGHFLHKFYKIKEVKRIGWVERGVEYPESVAAHMYGAFLLAYLYLPDFKMDNSEYNKDIILKKLLFHDLAESYTGDINSEKKTEKDKKIEANHFLDFSLLGTYNEIANTEELITLYSSFNRSDDINSRIAREVDKLDALMQLYKYNSDGNLPISIENFKHFEKDLIGNIQSDEGLRIMKIIQDAYDK